MNYWGLGVLQSSMLTYLVFLVLYSALAVLLRQHAEKEASLLFMLCNVERI